MGQFFLNFSAEYDEFSPRFQNQQECSVNESNWETILKQHTCGIQFRVSYGVLSHFYLFVL